MADIHFNGYFAKAVRPPFPYTAVPLRFPTYLIAIDRGVYRMLAPKDLYVYLPAPTTPDFPFFLIKPPQPHARKILMNTTIKARADLRPTNHPPHNFPRKQPSRLPTAPLNPSPYHFRGGLFPFLVARRHLRFVRHISPGAESRKIV